MSNERTSLITARPPGLVDVLDRILDKGLVIAGDIKISLANVELLTLQIRLLICSIDKAEQIGLNWWRYDGNLTTRNETAEADNAELRRRLAALEDEMSRIAADESVGSRRSVAAAAAVAPATKDSGRKRAARKSASKSSASSKAASKKSRSRSP